MTNRHDGAGDVQQVRRRGPHPLLALAAGAIAHFTRNRSSEITNEQLSGDWLAQARGREEQQPW